MDLQTGLNRIDLQPVKAAKGVACDLSNLDHYQLVIVSDPPRTS